MAQYQAILRAQPGHVDALNLSGVVAHQLGNQDAAVALIGQAITIAPQVADLHNNLGEVHRAGARYKMALTCFERACDLAPHHADAHNNRGLALRALDRSDAAIAAFQQALAIDPQHGKALLNLGASFRQVGAAKDALEVLERALQLRPGDIDARINYANALADSGRWDDAISAYRRALDGRPDDPRALIGYGIALKTRGQARLATAQFQRAVAVAPKAAEGHYNLAVDLAETGQLDTAIGHYRQALAADPDNVSAHVNLARLLLLTGQYAEGFDLWEWRWREPQTWRRHWPVPTWQGESLAERTILVWGEQGAGDEVMLASLLPDLAAEARQVIVECDPRLVPLFRRSFASVTVHARTDPPQSALQTEGINFHCAIGSLARWLRRDSTRFRQPTPYLRADAAQVATLRERYAARGQGPLIGIAWRSQSKRQLLADLHFKAQKSSELADWGPILDACPAQFINLQYGDCTADLAMVGRRFGRSIYADETVDQLRDLDRFAAQIAALDLVISTSNTAVHLAGALGCPAWTMVPAVPDWRWQCDRADTLWYPRMDLFRQQTAGDWTPVIASVAARLKQRFGDEGRTRIDRGQVSSAIG